MKKVIFSLSALSLLAFAAALFAAEAAPTGFVVENGEWRAQKNGQLSDPPSPNGYAETEAGRCYWLFADPETADEAKGAPRGLYIYREKGSESSFLPLAGPVNAVTFSSDGEMFIVEGPGEMEMNDVSLELFTTADSVSRFKTAKAAGSPHWIDVRRFVYTRNDPDQPRDRPDDYPLEGSSALLYDAVAWEETVLKKAGPTSDFSIGFLGDEDHDLRVLSEDGSGLILTETYVESGGDWADPDKYQMRQLTVPLPAAG